MSTVQKSFLAIVIIHACVSAAPSDTRPEDITEAALDLTLDQAPNVLAVELNDNSTTEQSQRQKRNYFHQFGYGFPPMNPIIYPGYYNRDDAFGSPQGDPFREIFRRLQDINQGFRYSNYPPPQPPPNSYPFLFPVIYIPQFGCPCFPEDLPPQNPSLPAPTPTTNGTDTDVNVTNRFPDMDDINQNWGIVVNDSEREVDDGQEEDFTRPISFEPIKPNRTMSRPPPPVEHGSSQAGQGREPVFTTTTARPFENPTTNRPFGNPTTNRPFGNPTTNRPFANPTQPSPVQVPSTCDGAILSCCHQPQITYDCFAVQGCPDPTAYGNPCDNQVILRVINKFQRFYGQFSG